MYLLTTQVVKKKDLMRAVRGSTACPPTLLLLTTLSLSLSLSYFYGGQWGGGGGGGGGVCVYSYSSFLSLYYHESE